MAAVSEIFGNFVAIQTVPLSSYNLRDELYSLAVSPPSLLSLFLSLSCSGRDTKEWASERYCIAASCANREFYGLTGLYPYPATTFFNPRSLFFRFSFPLVLEAAYVSRKASYLRARSRYRSLFVPYKLIRRFTSGHSSTLPPRQRKNCLLLRGIMRYATYMIDCDRCER